MDPIIGAALIGGGMGFLGAQATNRGNAKIANKQMDFQERMSSTAYQRAMLDMEKAGLNPILAYQQGGASSPGGASIAQQNELGAAANSALDATRLRAEINNIKADADLKRALKSAAIQDAQVKSGTAKSIEAQLPGLEMEKYIDSTKPGQFIRWVNRFLPILNSAKGLVHPGIGTGQAAFKYFNP